MQLETLMDGNKKMELEAAKRDAKAMLEEATRLAREIKDQKSLQVAVDYTISLRKAMKTWDAHNSDEKEKLNNLVKAFRERVASIREPMERAEAVLKPAISEFQMAQERARREAEARLMAENRRREEEERLAHAAELEKLGDKAAAEEVFNTPAPVAPVVLAKPTVEGGGFRTVWTFEIENPMLIPRQFLMPDEVAINRYVQSLKAGAKIPGVKIFEKAVLATKRGY